MSDIKSAAEELVVVKKSDWDRIVRENERLSSEVTDLRRYEGKLRSLQGSFWAVLNEPVPEWRDARQRFSAVPNV